VRNGSTSSPAVVACFTIPSIELQLMTAPRLGWAEVQSNGMRTLSTPPRLRRWNCSSLGTAWGTTPQKVAGTASAAEARDPRPAKTTIAAMQARAILDMRFLSFDIG
jgi:hypothetical protein